MLAGTCIGGAVGAVGAVVGAVVVLWALWVMEFHGVLVYMQSK